MAKILGKDQATYSKEHDGFLRDLQHFHETRGTPFRRPPTLGGREVDLYLLYTLVTSQGGWLRVNSKNCWNDVLVQLQLPKSCVNGGVALKQIYLRYLDRFEKVHFLHEEADRGSDDDEESRHKRWSARSLHSVPCTYNYNQHNIVEANREYNHLSTDLYKPSDYDRLALSLISPLPNEQDFAINVCTLLSNDGKHTLKLEKHPRILTYLLGHAGIYNHSSLRQLFIHYYSDIRKKPIHSFWKHVLESKDFLDLTNEDKFKQKQDEASPKYDSILKDDTTLLTLTTPMEVDKPVTPEVCENDCEIIEDSDICDRFKFNIEDPSDRELFCLRRSLGTQDYVGQRMLQIATILRNLSFIEENVPVLVKNTTFLRFLLLCVSSGWNMLKNLGMDMLGNIASDFIVKDFQTDILASSLVKIITVGLESKDRAYCLCSLEVLNKLSQNEQNEDVLLRSLPAQLYKSVCSFLSIHDVMLLIYTLECLYSLSSLGERSCNLIVINHGVIDTLVSLVTVEGKSYGPKACIGMKLVETVPSGSVPAQSQSQHPQSQVASSTTTTTSTGTSNINTSTVTSPSSVSVTPMLPAMSTTMSTPIVNAPAATKVVVTPSTPVRQVQVVPQRLIQVLPSPTTTTPIAPSPPTHIPVVSPAIGSPMTAQQLIQQQHAHQQAVHENEQFALAWLRASYEPSADGKIDHQEVYRLYMNWCQKVGRKGVISPLHFPRCVRSVFGGTVGPNPIKPANPTDSQYYEGIKVRDNPLLHTLPSISIPNPIYSTPNKGQQVVAGTQALKQVRRQSLLACAPSPTPLSVVAVGDGTAQAQVEGISQPCPASPILAAQLSAPPRQQDAVKSQAITHPHLSQALLGSSSSSTTSVTTVTVMAGTSKDPSYGGQGQSSQNQASSTSLIKSLLATKVNECMTTVSMRTATDCQNVAQVAARQQQQRLLAQQGSTHADLQQKASVKDPLRNSRLNGARQLFTDAEIGDPSVSSTTQFTSVIKDKKEPPQPPPPPLAPLSNNTKGKLQQRLDNEDSDSIGNNSVASSSGLGTVGVGGISSTEEGDNSLTSFEGLLNGIPNIENPLNEDSNSKDSVKIVSSEISMNKPLRLADLLEKKFEKSPPLLNGALGKDIRLGDKALDLVENHIEKALSRDTDNMKTEDSISEKICLKRSASEEIMDIDAKKPLLSTTINGSSSISPPPDSSSSNGDEAHATVSTAAAKLFADIAADILEDEDEEQLMQEVQATTQIIESPAQVQIATSQSGLPQIIVDNSQQVLLTQPRQIIVSQAQIQQPNQVMISAGTQLKTQTGQTVIVQPTSAQRPVMLQQTNPAGQFLLSQGLQGQMQLVASGTQPGQYVIQTSGQQGYVVAQPQTAVVHGQPQTVLLAQTPQQQGTAAKTIIILQQQPPNTATHHQKVVVTPQGQQVVVTQVPRPVAQTSTVSNNSAVSPSKMVRPITSSTMSVSTICSTPSISTTLSTSNSMVSIKKEPEDLKRPKVIRDLTTPFVCEWGDCCVDTKFKSANEVYLHACATHCPTGNEEVVCQWDRCDNMKRKRFSLMTHLQDKHCSPDAMRQGLVRRKQAAHSNKLEAPSASTNLHPGYAPDAALHAIKRHALEFVNPKELQLKPPIKPGAPSLSAGLPRTGPPPTVDQDDNEGPVTKSIRLTASLILRNLVIYNSHCKRYLKSYESHLANVALSNVESSRTIAQVLYDMNDGSTHR